MELVSKDSHVSMVSLSLSLNRVGSEGFGEFPPKYLEVGAGVIVLLLGVKESSLLYFSYGISSNRQSFIFSSK